MKSQTPLKWAKAAAQAADEKLGQDILILDVRGQSSVTDSFVFVSAASHLHVRALEDAIREKLREEGAPLQRTDGQRGEVWRVLDYGNLLVHVMDAKTREFYAIERLWDQGKKVRFSVKSKPAPRAPRAKKPASRAKKKR